MYTNDTIKAIVVKGEYVEYPSKWMGAQCTGWDTPVDENLRQVAIALRYKTYEVWDIDEKGYVWHMSYSNTEHTEGAVGCDWFTSRERDGNKALNEVCSILLYSFNT